MSTILHVITRSEFIEKYRAPFQGLDPKRLIDRELPDIELEELAQCFGPIITLGSNAPSKLIYSDGIMDPVQGEFMYSQDGKWYIFDGASNQQCRNNSTHGTGLLIPDYDNRRYNVKCLGIERKGKIYQFHPLDTDGTIISLPHLITPDAQGLHYLLRLDIPSEI